MSATAADMQLDSYQVGVNVLSSLYYIPNYVSEAEEQRILKEVHASQAKWVQLSGRRLQNHGGIVHAKGLIPASMPSWLEQLALQIHHRLPLFGDHPPNHVLINSYQPGCGIMPHQDGPLYHPVVCILSLGAPAVLRFWRKQPEGGTGNMPPVASLLAMPRSLLVFAEEAYEDCLHGILEVTHETVDDSVVNLQVLQLHEQREQKFPGQQHEQRGGMQEQQQQQKHRVQQQQLCRGQKQPQQQPCTPEHASSTAHAHVSVCRNGSSSSRLEGAQVVPREGERVSLTIRRVLKVHKAVGLFKK